jgi:hypothetical protein
MGRLVELIQRESVEAGNNTRKMRITKGGLERQGKQGTD